MGFAVDTIVGAATNPGAGGAAVVMNNADSNTVRQLASGTRARLDFLCRQGASEGFVEVKSPRFHDAVRGLHIITSETPAVLLLPQETGQPLYSGDNLQISVSGGAAEVDAVALGIAYPDLAGVTAQLGTWDQIVGSILNLVSIEVDVPAQAASAAWSDTKLTATEDVLKADSSYAVLGYTVDAACLAVGIRGAETGNLRLCGPGPVASFRTENYFVDMSKAKNAPYIPVIKANNRNNVFVSTSIVAVATAPKVQLLLAELGSDFTLP